MSYLNRSNDYQPTGRVNSEPDDEGHGGSPLEGRYEHPELYVDPAPEPAHQRDGVHTEALGESGYIRRPVPAGVHEGHVRVLRRALAEVTAEKEKLAAVLGHGPYVVIKLPVGWLEGGDLGQPVEVRLGYGGGVTRHLVRMIMELGMDAEAVEAGLAREAQRGQVRAVLGEQGDTIRLPQPAEKPQERLADWPDPEARPTY